MYSLRTIIQTDRKGQASFNYVLRPFIELITWICANLGMTPNQVTLLGFIFFIAGAISFYNKLFFLGAVFCLIRYLLDYADGKIARLRHMQSKFGALFDSVSSYFGTALCLLALFLTQERTLIFLISPFVIIMFFIHPIQKIFLSLFVNQTENKDYKNFLEYEDARNVALIIIPILFIFLKNLTINIYIALIFTVIIIGIEQTLWLFYHHKDFKRGLR